jgi:hypothetical protein
VTGGEGDAGIVVVPHTPGPLVGPGTATRRDGLDDLIDELLPDTDEGPGPMDAALVAGGAALVGWSVIGSPPVAATVAGLAAVGLGCILPVRSAWRWFARRRRQAAGAGGLPLRIDHPALARLAAAYESLGGLAATTEPARTAAHGAVLEVASLLDGRTPASDAENRYVGARVAAVENLAEALRAVEARGPTPGGEPPAVAPDLVVEAREELDALGASALSRLDDVTAEIRARGQGG